MRDLHPATLLWYPSLCNCRWPAVADSLITSCTDILSHLGTSCSVVTYRMLHEHHGQMWAVNNNFWPYSLMPFPQIWMQMSLPSLFLLKHLSVLCDWGSCHPCSNNEPSFKVTWIFSSWACSAFLRCHRAWWDVNSLYHAVHLCQSICIWFKTL